ncbi:putative EpsG family protein [Vibrio crassostreae]|nr:putative EpsG family protein [Vibrio crassostreae]CAK3448908.1 putative EpsG family protein [Vibrio crassostreae]
MIYFLTFLYLFSVSFWYDLNGARGVGKKINIYFAYFSLFLIAAFRFRIAPDSVAYEHYVNNEVVVFSELTLDFISNARFQPLWVVISSISKSLGGYLPLQMFVAFFSLASIYIFVERYIKYHLTFLLFFFVIFYHYFMMEILREAIAVSIFLIYLTLYHKNKISSLLLCVIAFMFHKYAFILFLFHIVYCSNIGYKRFLFISGGMTFVILLLDNPLDNIQTLVNLVTSKSNLSFYQLDVGMSTFGYLYHSMKISFPIVCILYLFKNKKLIDETTFRCFTMSVIMYTCVNLIRIFSIPFIDRITNYFMPVIIGLSVCALLLFLRRQDRVVYNIIFPILVIISVVFSWLPLTKVDPILNTPMYKRYYPYYSIFSEKTDEDREWMTYLEAKEL